jgi:hypothetical protein
MPAPVQGSPSSHDSPEDGAQVPAEPGMSQATQTPSQAESQQTPSTQWPLAHSSREAHSSPSALSAVQTPPSQ